MLRVPPLGLTFTHGISRLFLLQSPRCLYISPFHEPISLVSGLPRFCSTSKAEVSKTFPMVELPHVAPISNMSFSIREHFSTTSTISLETAAVQAKTETPLHHRKRDGASDEPSVERDSSKSVQLEKRRGVHPSPSQKAYEEHLVRRPMYDRLEQATDADAAWRIYQKLLRSDVSYITQPIPHKYLHTFAALLVSASKSNPAKKTRTQKIFLRLLSVLDRIHYSGGQLRLWEWNALIECAGRGWRKTRMDDFQASLNVFQDMLANRAPGSSFSNDPYDPLHDPSRVLSKPVTPDIVTYTTLLTIAGQTLCHSTLHHAESMLLSSRLPPNYITYLVYIRFYARRGELSQVRSVLSRMKENGFELDIDGLNACIWAYGRNGRVDIITLIYRILRNNVLPDSGTSNNTDIQDAVRELHDLEGLTVPAGLKPDAITYYTLIQIYAYRGRLFPSLDVLRDMMTLPQPVTGNLEDVDVIVSEPTLPQPILPIFRAIFLGFARHAALPGHSYSTSAAAPHMRIAECWTLEQLHILFGNFIDLPVDAKPSCRTVWCLLVAFAVTSGSDRALLRSVWEKLSARYGGRWDGRIDEFRIKIYAEEFDRAYFEGVCTRRKRTRSGVHAHSMYEAP